MKKVFSEKELDTLHKLSPLDNLHEMSNLIFWKTKKNIINLLSAEFANSMLSVNESSQ